MSSEYLSIVEKILSNRKLEGLTKHNWKDNKLLWRCWIKDYCIKNGASRKKSSRGAL